MFVQCTVAQATDHCAGMQTRGWLFCWLSKHDSSPAFAQGLVQSLQKTGVYDAIRSSDDICFSLLFTSGDRKTAVILGCDPRSDHGMTVFKRVLQWAMPNQLRIEIAPNRTDYDEHTRQLLADLALSQAPALSAAASESSLDHRTSRILADLLLIIHDGPPVMKDAFVRAVLKSLHLPVDRDTPIAAHQHGDAGDLNAVVPFALPLARRYLEERGLEFHLDLTQSERFTLVSPLETVAGHAFAAFGKPLPATKQ